jgi:hypothetical protein
MPPKSKEEVNKADICVKVSNKGQPQDQDSVRRYWNKQRIREIVNQYDKTS